MVIFAASKPWLSHVQYMQSASGGDWLHGESFGQPFTPHTSAHSTGVGIFLQPDKPALIRNGEFQKAEDVLLRAKETEPANPDVFGFLGYLYKQWAPRRATDARDAFRRAGELRTRKRDAYFHWIRLELDAKDAAVACEAAEVGLKNIPGNRTLLYWAGRAYDTAARELERGLHTERSSQARERATQHLTQALAAGDVEGGGPTSGMIYRALALSAEGARDREGARRYAAEWQKVAPSEAESDRDWRRLTGLE